MSERTLDVPVSDADVAFSVYDVIFEIEVAKAFQRNIKKPELFNMLNFMAKCIIMYSPRRT